MANKFVEIHKRNTGYVVVITLPGRGEVVGIGSNRRDAILCAVNNMTGHEVAALIDKLS